MVKIPCPEPKSKLVMPAKAGIQIRFRFKHEKTWIPACAGMTEIGVDFRSTNLDPFGLQSKVGQFGLIADREKRRHAVINCGTVIYNRAAE